MAKDDAVLEPFAAVNLVLIFFLMTGLGASIDPQDFKSKLKMPRALGFGMFIIFPLLMLGAVTIFDGFPPHFRVALTIVVTCPGGSLSNMISYVLKADLALSLAMTATASCVAIAMIPLNTFIYLDLISFGDGDNTVTLDWVTIAFTCGVIVFGMGCGFLVRSRSSPSLAKRVELFGLGAGLSTFAVGMWRNSGSNTPIWGLPRDVYLCMLVTTASAAFIVLISARYIVRLPKPSSVAIVVEVVAQNTNLALAITSLSVSDPTLVDEMVGVAIVYQFFHFWFSAGPALLLWKQGWTDLPPDQNPCACFDTEARNVPSCCRRRGAFEEPQQQQQQQDARVAKLGGEPL